jgi:predicted dithiol-disulfide oxidoreductase (DUF899 family)
MGGMVDRDEWLEARRALLAKEKALTRLRDEVAAERRALPRRRIDKDYVFAGPGGRLRLGDLFAGLSQLVVYHFMLGPTATEPCKSCSFWAEQYDALRVHLAHRDTELCAVSRAPLAKIEAVKARFAWRFPWYSSGESDFNFDFGVSFTEAEDGQPLYNYGFNKASKGELPGLSVFVKDASGAVFHTYSTYARGLDALNGTYQLLDLTPKGRQEEGLPWPMAWVRHKDRYEAP